MYWVEDGCTENGNEPDGSFKPTSYKSGVRCCSNDGKQCITPEDFNCPEDNMSYDAAVSKCAETDHRLCTKDELLSKVCCGTGGSCDSDLVWTSTTQEGRRSVIFSFM